MAETQLINNIQSFQNLRSGNQIILEDPDSFTMENSVIRFKGSNNILYCEGNVDLQDCSIKFDANNSIIYLSRDPKHKYRLNVTLNNNCSMFFGQDCFFNSPLNAICSEQCHLFVGREALFSTNNWIRTADPHLVYSSETMQRINDSRSVFLGDHVWLGQDAMLLKGTQIHSGSIIGAKSLVTGKRIPSNTSWGGNPAKQIADKLFWDETVVHKWTAKDTKAGKVYEKGDLFIFEHPADDYLSFAKLEKALNRARTAVDKLDYFKSLVKSESKNRFAWKPADKPEPKSLKHKFRMLLKRMLLRIMQ